MKIKLVEFANIVDPDKSARNKASQQDLQTMQKTELQIRRVLRINRR